MHTSSSVHFAPGDEIEISAKVHEATILDHPYAVIRVGPVDLFELSVPQLDVLARVATEARDDLLRTQRIAEAQATIAKMRHVGVNV